MKSAPTIYQHFLNKKALNPSDPRALLSGMESKVVLILTLLMGRSSVVVEEADVVFG